MLKKHLKAIGYTISLAAVVLLLLLIALPFIILGFMFHIALAGLSIGGEIYDDASRSFQTLSRKAEKAYKEVKDGNS